MLIAITRIPGPELVACELTYLPRQTIDVARALAQHDAYCAALAALGVHVVRLPAAAGLPDACFVEDTAVVVAETAVLMRPGAASRQTEVDVIAAALAPHRSLVRVTAPATPTTPATPATPATIDGGDVLVLDRTLLVGLSARTTRDGAEAAARLLAPHGYRVHTIPIHDCLHLETAVTRVAGRVLLVQPAWVDVQRLLELAPGFELVTVDDSEPFAANALQVGDAVLYPAGFPRTRARLAARGIAAKEVDISELQKAEAGVTCLSLLFSGQPEVAHS